MAALTVKTCPVCGAEFETKTKQKIYCSKSCANKASAAARAKLTVQTTRPCDECPREKDCSTNCDRYRAWFAMVWARMREDARPALVAVQKQREEAQQADGIK